MRFQGKGLTGLCEELLEYKETQSSAHTASECRRYDNRFSKHIRNNIHCTLPAPAPGPAPLLPDVTSHPPPAVRGRLGAAGLSPGLSSSKPPSERQVNSGNCSGPHSCRECWGDTWVSATLPPTSRVVLGKSLQLFPQLQKSRTTACPPSWTVRCNTHGLTERLAKSRNSEEQSQTADTSNGKQLLHCPCEWLC